MFVNIFPELVEWFWPDNQESIWDQIKEQVYEVVRKEIVALEQRLLASKLATLRDNIKFYLNPPNNALRLSVLSDIIDGCNSIKNDVIESP